MATKTFKIPEALEGLGSHGCCQGCGHGVVVRLIAEVLDELGVDWEPNNTAEQSWDEKFNMLLEYEKEHGSLDVPQAHCFLGAWVAKQRQLKKKGKLLPERERRLVDIGFVWESPNRVNV